MIVIDVETTGIDPKKHSILSIGAVDFDRPMRQFYGECRAREGAEVSRQALEINGFDELEIYSPNKMSLHELVTRYLTWMIASSDMVCCGQNVGTFDMPFIKDSLERYSLKWPAGHRSVDTHSVAYAHMLAHGRDPTGGSSRSRLGLDEICAYVGLPSEPKPHNALTGAKMEAEAMNRLLYGKPLLPEFAEYEVPEQCLKWLS